MPTIIQDPNNPNVSYSIPTAEELAANAIIQAQNDAANALQAQKVAIQAQLDIIDLKSIRALRTGDTARMATFESQASQLRSQLAAL